MSDQSLRLPNTTFRAVLKLGPKRAASMPLPEMFAAPDFMGEWDDEERRTMVYVHFIDGELHLEMTDSGFEYHFHRSNDEEPTSTSPWSDEVTEPLLAWAALLVGDFHAQMPDLQESIYEASAWYDEGFFLYVCETEEPAHLDLIEIEVEGEMLTLPWLGAGHVGHEHIDGNDHPIELLWNPSHDQPDRRIAIAWLDPLTDQPRTEAAPGVDWHAVGLPQDEVLSWLEGIYINHHIIPDVAEVLTAAVLMRMAGTDS